MSEHHVSIPEDVRLPQTALWSKLPLLGIVAGAAGLVATFATLGTNREYVAHSYLFAFALWLSVALGCLAFVLIQHVVRAGWSASVRRLFESGMAPLWVFALLFIPVAWLGHDLFPWTHAEHLDETLKKKIPYLNEGFFFVRAALYFVIWVALSQYLYRRSVRLDDVSDAHAKKRIVHSLWKAGALGVILFGLSQSFAAFDWLMSLQPHWYSTMFGVYFFAGSMLGAYSFITLVAMALQRDGAIKTALTTEHYHDLGKFLFGHTVFWAYIAFSQFMLIWYANIPEEVEFFYVRMEHGWAPLSYILPLSNFFIPFFFLLSRHVKRNRVALACAAVYIFVVHMVDIYWLVMPTVSHGHFPNSNLWIDVAAVVGVGGIFLAVFGWYLSRHNLVATGDPRLVESLTHQNF